MAKYSFEFKKEIVVAYLSGKGGFGSGKGLWYSE